MLDIVDIQELCRRERIRWSAHASQRRQQRGISIDDVIHCIMSGEIIEYYPEAWKNPACLILGYSEENAILHVVVGVNDYLHIITVYYPDEEKFEPDMKTRKGR